MPPIERTRDQVNTLMKGPRLKGEGAQSSGGHHRCNGRAVSSEPSRAAWGYGSKCLASPLQIAILGEVLQSSPVFRAMRPISLCSIAMGLTFRISMTSSNPLGLLLAENWTPPEQIVAKVRSLYPCPHPFPPSPTSSNQFLAQRRDVEFEGC